MVVTPLRNESRNDSPVEVRWAIGVGVPAKRHQRDGTTPPPPSNRVRPLISTCGRARRSLHGLRLLVHDLVVEKNIVMPKLLMTPPPPPPPPP